MGTDQHGFNLVYTPGESVERKLFALILPAVRLSRMSPPRGGE